METKSRADELQRIGEMAKSEDSRTRAEAMYELFRKGVDANVAVTLLSAGLSDSARNVRSSAARALGLMGAAAAKAEMKLVELLADDDDWVRDAAADGLAGIGCSEAGLEKAGQVIAHYLRSRNPLPLSSTTESSEPDGPKVAKLIEIIRTGDRSERLKALLKIGDYGPLAAPDLPLISEYLQDENWMIRMAAAEAMLAISPRLKAAALFSETLTDAHPLARVLAARGVRKDESPPEPEPIVFPRKPLPGDAKSLASFFGDSDDSIRASAAEAMGRIGPAAAEYADQLINLLEDKEWKVRSRAAEALLRVGAASKIPAEKAVVLAVLVDKYSGGAAIELLEAMGPSAKAAVPTLISVAESGGPNSLNAIQALTRIGLPAELLKRASFEFVSDYVLRFGRLLDYQDGLRGPEDRKCVEDAFARTGKIGLAHARMYLKGGQPEIRRQVAGALSAMGADAVGPLAEALSSDPVAEVRIAAAKSLGRLGPAARGAREALSRAANDKEADVAAAAKAALKAVAGE